MILHGILPAAVTPFLADRADPAAMQRNIAFWTEAGVHGVLVFGSTGEYVYLDDEERRTVLQAARQALPADRLLLVGCGAESTRAALRYLEEAAAAGADAALVVTPVYYTRGDVAAQRRHYQHLADHSPLPIMLYTVPAFTAYDLDLSLIQELAQHPRIVGMKESSGDLRRVAAELAGGGEGFALFAGSPHLIFPALALGASGSITAFANVIPELMIGVWQAVRAGDLARAAHLQTAISAFGQTLARYGIPGIKAVATVRGLVGGDVRSPLSPTPPEGVAACVAAWEKAMAAL